MCLLYRYEPTVGSSLPSAFHKMFFWGIYSCLGNHLPSFNLSASVFFPQHQSNVTHEEEGIHLIGGDVNRSGAYGFD